MIKTNLLLKVTFNKHKKSHIDSAMYLLLNTFYVSHDKRGGNMHQKQSYFP